MEIHYLEQLTLLTSTGSNLHTNLIHLSLTQQGLFFTDFFFVLAWGWVGVEMVISKQKPAFLPIASVH
jgi:hypothetical protein